MIPVYMSSKHDPENGTIGDCFRACLASLLELPIEEVPHFLYDNCDAPTFNGRVSKFLNSIGYWIVCVPAFDLATYMKEIGSQDTYHLISDRSPRFEDCMHAVVGRNGVVVHDPAGIDCEPLLNTSERIFEFLCKL